MEYIAKPDKTIKGYFVEFNGEFFGPVPSEKHAEELAVYIIAKNKTFKYRGHGAVEVLGEPPYICKGKIVLEENKLKSKDIKREYQLAMVLNPKARQEQLFKKMIEQGEKVDPDELQKQIEKRRAEKKKT